MNDAEQTGILMPRLTTHVLDTASGRPAAGVAVRAFRLGSNRELVASMTTNADGRTDQPLLDDDAAAPTAVELEFDVGDYFAASADADDDARFLDTVVIRVTLAAGQRYHVPLLASPWSYSTYRGS